MFSCAYNNTKNAGHVTSCDLHLLLHKNKNIIFLFLKIFLQVAQRTKSQVCTKVKFYFTKVLEAPGIDPGTSYMLSKRSTI